MSNVIDASIKDESRDRFLTYALSVVSGRALPDVRDGLKPVQRRILYAMFRNLNLKPTSSYRKSAAIVGAVLASYHPHGDSACYEAMVRMAQDFSLRYPLVDGQGNFGSVDGDNAAAYRYTEAKLTPMALELIGEIDEETVPFRLNFDATTEEPVVFPSRIPNLLLNGSSGIAVGMATSIPPHNLKEIVKALLELIDDPEISIPRLVTAIRGPDFPTGCDILSTKRELDETYRSGRGSIRMRGTWEVEELGRGKKAIVITTIPYAVNKSQLVEKIATLIIEKKIPQLTDIRDESTEEMRVVVELASGADPEVAMAYVFKHTPLESNFPVNLTVLIPEDNGTLKPELASLKEILTEFLAFREEVVEKRLRYEKGKLLERIHILQGLVKIFDALDEVIKIVRKSDGRSDAASKLIARFKLSEIQSYAVVDMRIYQLSKTNIQEIREELKEKEGRVSEIDKILRSKKGISDIVRKELESLAEKYGDKRKCSILKEVEEAEFNAEDYVVREEVYAIVTSDGWIKRIRQANELSTTRTREGDSIKNAHPLSTTDFVAFFTNLGSLYSLRVSEFPSSSGYGDPIQKLLKFKDGEKIVQSYGVRAGSSESESKGVTGEIKEGDTILFVTERGMGFAMKVSELCQTRKAGKRVINVREGDSLVCAAPLRKAITFLTKEGSALTINASEVPVRENSAVGVILMGTRSDDGVEFVLTYDKATKFVMKLASGRTKEILASEIPSGRRGLKGNKVASRVEVTEITIE